MSSPTESETKLIDEIVCKVKSEGLFDQFRRECLADADTKPAFLNVQQRVEAAVGTFLDDTEWTTHLNKNQLRERLRKSITNESFFEAGIERIVDQVVNPKLNTNLVPKCQDVAYKFLGIEKPLFIMNFDVKTENDTELPLELEQVDSPESDDKSMALHPPGNDDEYVYEKADDFESPAFEPIESATDFKVKQEYVERQEDDMDISDGDDVPLQMNGSTLIQNDEAKSNLSSISGLTSSDSQADCMAEIADTGAAVIKMECNASPPDGPWHNDEAKEQQPQRPPEPPEAPECLAPEISVDTAHNLPKTDENVISADVMIEHMSHDSVLSQVSSTSRLSIVTNNNTNTRMDDGDSNHTELGTANYETTPTDTCPYGISEEAQMQKFNESSSSSNSLVIDTDNVSNGAVNKADAKQGAERMTSFDIKRQEIKFEGTSRKSIDLAENGDSKQAPIDAFDVNSTTACDQIADAPKFEHETESTGSRDKPELGVDLKGSGDDKSTNTADTDDSKPTDESSSSNHKLKDRHRDGKTSSSSRNGNDSEHHKHRSKERSHHSSSKDRHRDKDRDKDKDRKPSLTSSTSSKDKSKSLRDESESRDSTSKHRDSTSSSSKYSASKHDDHNRSSHHKSSTSTSTSKDKSKSDKHSVSSTSSNSHSSSKLKDKDHTRHSSTSSSKDKDISKRDSKHSDSKRHRSESHRAASKKDDHYTHKDKSGPRQRSRSKDSNDGNHRLSQPSMAVPAQPCADQAAASSTAIEKAEAGSSTKEPQPIASHAAIAGTSEAEASVTDTNKLDIEINKLRSDAAQMPTSSQEDGKFVMVTQPVRVDQILSGKELNLGIFIDENRDDPVVSSIEQSLELTAKKPKLAANMLEARRLAKVRKEMELDEQKKVEKAMVLAKQHIRTNAATLRDDSNQGIELEFVCVNSVTGEGKTTGPTISSPIKYANGVKLPEVKRLTPTATAASSADTAAAAEQQQPARPGRASDDAPSMDVVVHSSDDDSDDFYGFDATDLKLLEDQLKLQLNEPPEKARNKRSAASRAKAKGSSPTAKRIANAVNEDGSDQQQLYDMLTADNQLLFLENNKIGKHGLATSKLMSRKRKADNTAAATGATATAAADVASSSSELNAASDDMIVASVVISQTNNECSDKPDSSTRSETDTLSALEKQRQKTRYSNEDLFKPRPVLGGGSRSRRRGFNCNE